MKPSSFCLGRRGFIRIGFGGAALLSGSCKGSPASATEVSVTEFGAYGDGARDDTAAFQQACDRLTAGGTLQVPRGTYLLNRVFIRNRNIRIALDPAATLLKRAPAELDLRGIFQIDGLHDAGFELRGGAVDLNAEGPMAVGRLGRIPNLYSPQTLPDVVGIAGPVNAAVFARRSSGIAVVDCTIANSGESGLLFRNCGRISVRGCRFSNLANYGVEFSFVLPENDGGLGSMPARNDCEVIGCHFENIDDYALGTGNGVGVGGGGVGNLGGFRNYRISDCSFVRCQRDIHFEFHQRSWMEQLEVARISSTEARQGSIGLVSVRHSVVRDVVVHDAGSAPTALLIAARPEVYGLVLSSGFTDILLKNIIIRDTRPGRMLSGGGASIERGSQQLRSSANTFAEDDVGRWFGFSGGNPHGAAYVGRIAAVISPGELELNLPAGATVRDGRFALGGLTRNGVILSGGSDVMFEDVHIEAGASADPASMNEAAAVRMWGMTGQVRFDRTDLRAPRGGSTPIGVRISANRASLVGLDRIAVQGYGSLLDAVN